MYYVYELVNLLGTVEHVGQTVRPRIRFWEHTSTKPKKRSGKGKFYGRLDISMHIVSTFETKSEALQAEYDLQIQWGLPTDRETNQGSKQGNSKLKEDQVREIKSLLSQNLSCGEIGRRFEVSNILVSLIRDGKRRTHVK